MICPECGAEYQPGFTECADCRITLVEPRDDAGPSAPGESWTVLTEHTFRFGWASLGTMDDTGFRLIALKSELEAQGIEAWFDPFAPGEGGGFTDTFYQPIRLLVQESELDRARALMNDLDVALEQERQELGDGDEAT